MTTDGFMAANQRSFLFNNVTNFIINNNFSTFFSPNETFFTADEKFDDPFPSSMNQGRNEEIPSNHFIVRLKILVVSAYCALLIVGLCGNSWVIVTILTIFRQYGSHKSSSGNHSLLGHHQYHVTMRRKSVSSLGGYSQQNHLFGYILVLSIVDLLLLLTIPLSLTDVILETWMFGDIICVAYWFIESANKILSISILTLLSFDRFLALRYPSKSIRFRARFSVRYQLVVAIVMTVLLILPMLVHTKIKIFSPLTLTTETTVDNFDPNPTTTLSPSIQQQQLYSNPTEATSIISIMNGNKEKEEVEFADFFSNDNNNNSINIIANESRTIMNNSANHSQNFDSIEPAKKDRPVVINSMVHKCANTMPRNRYSTIFFVYMFAYGYLIPAILITVFYGSVIAKLRKSLKRTTITSTIPVQGITRSILSVVTFYFVCWTPYWFTTIITALSSEVWPRLFTMSQFFAYNYVVHGLVYLNSAGNWIFYALMNRELHRMAHNRKQSSGNALKIEASSFLDASENIQLSVRLPSTTSSNHQNNRNNLHRHSWQVTRTTTPSTNRRAQQQQPQRLSHYQSPPTLHHNRNYNNNNDNNSHTNDAISIVDDIIINTNNNNLSRSSNRSLLLTKDGRRRSSAAQLPSSAHYLITTTTEDDNNRRPSDSYNTTATCSTLITAAEAAASNGVSGGQNECCADAKSIMSIPDQL